MDTHKGAEPPSAARAPLRGSAAWRYFGDIRNFLIAPQLLLLQVAHPVVGAGVEDHSDFRAAPWQRLWRTVSSLHTVIYGGQAAATAEGERLLRVHAPLKGTDSQGRRYHALNPEAYHWVHATLVRGGYDGHRIFGTGLSAEETEEYYRGMRDVGRIWGLKDHHLPPDWASFCAYYDETVGERLELNQSVLDVLTELRRPQKPPVRRLPEALWRPVGAKAAHYVLLVTVGTLPPALRERLDLEWSPREERALRRFVRLVRVLVKLVPPPLRLAGALAIAYWNTHGPGTDPSARRPLGAPA